MNLAFWRRRRDSAGAAPKRSSARAATNAGSPSTAPGEDNDAGDRSVDASALRVRARRRLIGAAALLLTVAVVVPMLLDPAPRPVSDGIAIDIPSEKTPFAPRLSLPPVPAPETTPLAPPADAPGVPAAADALARAEPAAKAGVGPALAGKADDTRVAAAAKADVAGDEKRARALLEGKAGDARSGESSASALPAVDKGGKFAVQAAAPASETAARELAERLRKSGFAPYTERTETKEGVRFRVRVGPYATRDEADKARARLKTIGITANVVSA